MALLSTQFSTQFSKIAAIAAATAAVALGVYAGPATAASVSCGDAVLGVRTVTVDPALAGGLCYAQLGNLQNADIAVLGLTEIDKDVRPDGMGEGALDYTLNAGNVSGGWSFASSLWDSWGRLFLGFHFGQAGDGPDSNPDSFVIELAPGDTSGTWALGGTGASLNALSNIHLLGRDPESTTPEPGTLALLGLAMAAMGFATRRRRH